MKNKIIIFVILIISLNFLFAGQIKYDKDYKKHKLYNKDTKKILNYFLILPGDEIKFTTFDVDTISIFTRIINDKILTYQYKIYFNSTSKTITKTSKPSQISRTLKGESVSSYNKYVRTLDSKNKIIIENISKEELLVKVSADKAEKSIKNVEYVKFSPEFYESEKIISIDEKSYTYYTSGSNKIRFVLEGPVLIKIISRLIFDDILNNNLGYEFKVFDNGKEITSFTERAHKSRKAIILEMKDKTISTGDVNILELPAGVHNISLEDIDSNRNLIFCFYINKSSIGILDK